jgi:hypothetical protein
MMGSILLRSTSWGSVVLGSAAETARETPGKYEYAGGVDTESEG